MLCRLPHVARRQRDASFRSRKEHYAGTRCRGVCRHFMSALSPAAACASGFLATFLLAPCLVWTTSNAHALELDIEALSSLNGSGKIGVRVAGGAQIWGPVRLSLGVAALPGAVIIDLTPALRIGDDA